MPKHFKHLFFNLFFLFCCSSLLAQNIETDSFPAQFRQQLSLRKDGLLTLGVWALGNMAVSGTSYFFSKGSNQKFHQMNVMWNTVNLSLALSGLYQSHLLLNKPPDKFQFYKDETKLQKILLFNAGLDVGYIATGFYLKERGLRGGKYEDTLNGYGQSLILQGAFLLVFDSFFYFVLNQNFSPQIYF